MDRGKKIAILGRDKYIMSLHQELMAVDDGECTVK